MKCCDLSAGKLRHLVDLQNRQDVDDDLGGVVTTWATFSASQRGMLKPLTGTEIQRAGRLEANITHKLYMRYRTDLTAAHSVLYEGRRMQVRAVIDIEERKRWIEVSLEEGVAT